jgi:sulfur carrier protein
MLNVNCMHVFINGETREIDTEMSLSDLLKQLSLPSERIAIELNKEVVRRRNWETIQIKEADRIEIVHFVGGG